MRVRLMRETFGDMANAATIAGLAFVELLQTGFGSQPNETSG
jgi:hypothetical protein